MINGQKKKQIFYEVNPLFFYDGNEDGFGDFIGFNKKIDYFSFVGIDCIIIPDIFNNYNNLMFNNFINLKNLYGNLDDLKKVIINLKQKKIGFAVEINIKDIQRSLLFSADGTIKEYDFGESKKSFFLDKNQTENISENWNSRKTLESFKKIIMFWLSLNVNNFVFVNFEYLFHKNQVFSSTSKEQLQELYRMTNQLNPKVTIFIKSALLSQKNIKDCLDVNDPCANYFIDSSYSLLGTNAKTQNDKLEKFKPYKLFTKIKQMILAKNDDSNVIMALASNLSGRINSRWGSEHSFCSLSSKALITINLANSNSSLIYYGDELGMLKINIKNSIDFHDINAIERKRAWQSRGLSQKDFNLAQQYLSPINNQSLFQWDRSMNGGFSKANKVLMRQVSSTYQTINVAEQYNNPDSSLIFLKKIIEFVKNPIYAHFFNDSTIKVQSISRDVIKYTHKAENQEKLFIFINISQKWKKVQINKKLKVVFSNYTKKQYDHKIKFLAPFEAIILFPKKEYIS